MTHCLLTFHGPAAEPFTARTDARVCGEGERPGPNDLMRCGTESAAFRHRAKGEECQVCDPSDEESNAELEGGKQR